MCNSLKDYLYESILKVLSGQQIDPVGNHVLKLLKTSTWQDSIIGS